MPPKPKSITIIGAGIAGLTLARALRTRGIAAALHDRHSSPRNFAYSIVLQPRAYKPLLNVLGLSFAELERKAGVVEGSEGLSNDGEPNLRVNRGTLEGLLRDGLHVTWGTEVERVELNESRSLILALKDGRKLDIAADGLRVAADGVHSPIRKDLLPESAETEVLPFVVFNGKRTVPYEVFQNKFADAFRKSGITELSTRVSISGSASLLQTYVNTSILEAQKEGLDSVNISYTYSRPAKQSSNGDEDPLWKPQRATSGASEIPEEFYKELSSLQATSMEPFRSIFDPKAARGDRVLHWLMRSMGGSRMPTVDQLKDLASKQVVFIGDSIQAAPIIGSAGANLAILDALQLADWIVEGRDLTTYVDEKYPAWCEEVAEGEERIATMHGKRKATL